MRRPRLLTIAILGLVITPHAAVAQRGSGGYIPQLYAGQRALDDKRWGAAASHFRAALIFDHKGTDALLGLGSVYLKTGRQERAVEEFNAVLRVQPHSAAAERLIHEARTPGEEENAFKALEDQVRAEPNNADVQATYAEELIERDRLDEAMAAAQTAIRLNASEGHAYCALGRAYYRKQDDVQARKNLEIAVKHDPTDDDALMTLGDIAVKAKDYKTAIDYYRRVTHVVPEETEGHKKLLAALQADGNARDAAREQETITKLEGQP
jgi:cytochrome c-type biogenesis protein CcmH/NrfG